MPLQNKWRSLDFLLPVFVNNCEKHNKTKEKNEKKS